MKSREALKNHLVWKYFQVFSCLSLGLDHTSDPNGILDRDSR